jgi:hypothetical protein
MHCRPYLATVCSTLFTQMMHTQKERPCPSSFLYKQIFFLCQGENKKVSDFSLFSHNRYIPRVYLKYFSPRNANFIETRQNFSSKGPHAGIRKRGVFGCSTAVVRFAERLLKRLRFHLCPRLNYSRLPKRDKQLSYCSAMISGRHRSARSRLFWRRLS